jgi:hypothetical protein
MEIKKITRNLNDLLAMGSKEVERNYTEIKKRVQKHNLIQRKKEAFTELGRLAYEAIQTQWESNPEATSGGPSHTLLGITADMSDAVQELKNLDHQLSQLESQN